MRILYITHSLSATGATCLAALIDRGYTIAAVVTPTLRGKRGSLAGAVASFVRRRGVAFTILVSGRTCIAHGRTALRRRAPAAGSRLAGYASIDEVATVYRLHRLYPADLNDPAFVQEAAALRPDLVVIGVSDRIVKEPLLSTFAGRILNLHPAPLPRFRGPDPLYWQLVLGEPHGAVSVHYVTPEIDGGHLLAQERFAIEPGETERGLKRAVDRVAPRVLADAIERARTGDPGDPQNACDATYQKSRPKGIAACFPRGPRRPRRHDLAERATR